jgi:transposase
MGRREHRRFTPEFKAEAVRLVSEADAPLTHIARDLGISVQSLRSWVDAARPQPREPLNESERTELQRLRRENRQLRTERDILKKATAFFARQND